MSRKLKRSWQLRIRFGAAIHFALCQIVIFLISLPVLAQGSWTPDLSTTEGQLRALQSVIAEHPDLVRSNLQYGRNFMELLSPVHEVREQLGPHARSLEFGEISEASVRYMSGGEYTYNQEKLTELRDHLVSQLEGFPLRELEGIREDIQTLREKSKAEGKDSQKVFKRNVGKIFRLLPFLYEANGEPSYKTLDQPSKRLIAEVIRESSPHQLETAYGDLVKLHFKPVIEELAKEKGFGQLNELLQRFTNSFIKKQNSLLAQAVRPVSKSESGSLRSVSIQELPSIVPLFRGAFGGDCSMLSVPYHVLVDGVKVYAVRKSSGFKGTPAGYAFVAPFRVGQETLPYLVTVNGTLTADDVRTITQMIQKEWKTSRIVLPNFSKVRAVVNTNQMQEGMTFKGARSIEGTLPAGWETVDEITNRRSVTGYSNYYGKEILEKGALVADALSDRALPEPKSRRRPSPYPQSPEANQMRLVDRAVLAAQAEKGLKSQEKREEIQQSLKLTDEQIRAGKNYLEHNVRFPVDLETYQETRRVLKISLRDIGDLDMLTAAHSLGKIYRESERGEGYSGIATDQNWQKTSDKVYRRLAMAIDAAQEHSDAVKEGLLAQLALPKPFRPRDGEVLTPFFEKMRQDPKQLPIARAVFQAGVPFDELPRDVYRDTVELLIRNLTDSSLRNTVREYSYFARELEEAKHPLTEVDRELAPRFLKALASAESARETEALLNQTGQGHGTRSNQYPWEAVAQNPEVIRVLEQFLAGSEKELTIVKHVLNSTKDTTIPFSKRRIEAFTRRLMRSTTQSTPPGPERDEQNRIRRLSFKILQELVRQSDALQPVIAKELPLYIQKLRGNPSIPIGSQEFGQNTLESIDQLPEIRQTFADLLTTNTRDLEILVSFLNQGSSIDHISTRKLKSWFNKVASRLPQLDSAFFEQAKGLIAVLDYKERGSEIIPGLFKILKAARSLSPEKAAQAGVLVATMYKEDVLATPDRVRLIESMLVSGKSADINLLMALQGRQKLDWNVLSESSVLRFHEFLALEVTKPILHVRRILDVISEIRRSTHFENATSESARASIQRADRFLFRALRQHPYDLILIESFPKQKEDTFESKQMRTYLNSLLKPNLGDLMTLTELLQGQHLSPDLLDVQQTRAFILSVAGRFETFSDGDLNETGPRRERVPVNDFQKEFVKLLRILGTTSNNYLPIVRDAVEILLPKVKGSYGSMNLLDELHKVNQVESSSKKDGTLFEGRLALPKSLFMEVVDVILQDRGYNKTLEMAMPAALAEQFEEVRRLEGITTVREYFDRITSLLSRLGVQPELVYDRRYTHLFNGVYLVGEDALTPQYRDRTLEVFKERLENETSWKLSEELASFLDRHQEVLKTDPAFRRMLNEMAFTPSTSTVLLLHEVFVKRGFGAELLSLESIKALENASASERGYESGRRKEILAYLSQTRQDVRSLFFTEALKRNEISRFSRDKTIEAIFSRDEISKLEDLLTNRDKLSVRAYEDAIRSAVEGKVTLEEGFFERHRISLRKGYLSAPDLLSSKYQAWGVDLVLDELRQEKPSWAAKYQVERNGEILSRDAKFRTYIRDLAQQGEDGLKKLGSIVDHGGAKHTWILDLMDADSKKAIAKTAAEGQLPPELRGLAQTITAESRGSSESVGLLMEVARGTGDHARQAIHTLALHYSHLPEIQKLFAEGYASSTRDAESRLNFSIALQQTRDLRAEWIPLVQQGVERDIVKEETAAERAAFLAAQFKITSPVVLQTVEDRVMQLKSVSDVKYHETFSLMYAASELLPKDAEFDQKLLEWIKDESSAKMWRQAVANTISSRFAQNPELVEALVSLLKSESKSTSEFATLALRGVELENHPLKEQVYETLRPKLSSSLANAKDYPILATLLAFDPMNEDVQKKMASAHFHEKNSQHRIELLYAMYPVWKRDPSNQHFQEMLHRALRSTRDSSDQMAALSLAQQFEAKDPRTLRLIVQLLDASPEYVREQAEKVLLKTTHRSKELDQALQAVHFQANHPDAKQKAKRIQAELSKPPSSQTDPSKGSGGEKLRDVTALYNPLELKEMAREAGWRIPLVRQEAPETKTETSASPTFRARAVNHVSSMGTVFVGQLGSEAFWALVDQDSHDFERLAKEILTPKNLIEFSAFAAIHQTANRGFDRIVYGSTEAAMQLTPAPKSWVMRRYMFNHGLAMGGAMWLTGLGRMAWDMGSLEEAWKHYATLQSTIHTGVAASSFLIARTPFTAWKGIKNARKMKWAMEGVRGLNRLRRGVELAESAHPALWPVRALEEIIVFGTAHGIDRVLLPLIDKTMARQKLQNEIRDFQHLVAAFKTEEDLEEKVEAQEERYYAAMGMVPSQDFLSNFRAEHQSPTVDTIQKKLDEVYERFQEIEQSVILRRFFEKHFEFMEERQKEIEASLVTALMAEDPEIERAIRAQTAHWKQRMLHHADSHREAIQKLERAVNILDEGRIAFEDLSKTERANYWLKKVRCDGGSVLEDAIEGFLRGDGEDDVIPNQGISVYDDELAFGNYMPCFITQRLDRMDYEAYVDQSRHYIPNMGFEEHKQTASNAKFNQQVQQSGMMPFPETIYEVRLSQVHLLDKWEAMITNKFREVQAPEEELAVILKVIHGYRNAITRVKKLQEEWFAQHIKGRAKYDDLLETVEGSR